MARLAFNHPNRKRLVAWLEQMDLPRSNGADEIDPVTAHLEQCVRCSDRLEELSGAVPDEPGLIAEIGAALRVVYEPPAGINDRVMKKIDERERSDREINLFLGLFGIATDAADLMMPDDPSGSARNMRRAWEEET